MANLLLTKVLPSDLQVKDSELDSLTSSQDGDSQTIVPAAQRSFVHFVPDISDSSSSTIPLSLSVTNELPTFYQPSSSLVSRLSISTTGSKEFKSTLISRSQSEISQGFSLTPSKKTSQPFHHKSAVIGEGEDYFLSLFGPSKKLLTSSSQPEKSLKHFSVILEDVGQSRYSALGDIKISELNSKGLFVRFINSSSDKELEIGNHILQQKVDGQTVSWYRFLPNIIMQANSTVTVWAAASEGRDDPPSDFLWKEQEKLCTSPNCTTILCKPNGEAIAWYTPIHWKQAWEKLETDIDFDRRSIVSPISKKHMFRWPAATSSTFEDDQDHAKETHTRHHSEPGHNVLLIEKEVSAALFPTRSPWCSSPTAPAHPYCSLIAPHSPPTTTECLLRQPALQPGTTGHARRPRKSIHLRKEKNEGKEQTAQTAKDNETSPEYKDS